ncbi:MAG: PRTRC system protein C [Zoogloea sp.]|nr:PRTRC system protein C [Zoogloea sp.]
MSIAISEIRRVFRYNGMQLPDVPGLEPREVRDLYSAQYPELVSAEIEAGEVRDGVREYIFRKAVGTKGGVGAENGRLAALNASVQAESAGRTGTAGKLARALTRRGTVERGSAWGAFVLRTMREVTERRGARVLPTSDMLAPLP